MKRRSLIQATTLALCLAAAGLGHAQIATNKGPLKIIVGYPAGGSADAVGRMLAEKLKDELGMPVIVDNRAGAGGQIAADFVKLAPADGLTVLLANTHMMVMLPLTTKSVKYDPLKDFKAVGRVTSFYEAVTVPATNPATKVSQWLDGARADPKFASYGIPAPGSMSQFIGFRMGSESKVSLLPVSYRGTAPLVPELIGGQMGGAIIPVGDVAQFHKTGKLRVLAVNGPRRAASLPDVPTLKEVGWPGFESLEWTGLLVPPATPRPVIDQLHAALAKVLALKDVQENLMKIGMEADPSTSDALTTLITDDLAKWGPVIKASGFTVD